MALLFASPLIVAPAVAAVSSWTIVPSPNPTSPPPAELTGVSCPTTTACLVVGKYTAGAPGMFSERWNGTSWSVAPSPEPSGVVAAFVNGIDCVTATFCVAVGYQALSDESNAKTLIEQWNGTTWSAVSSPNVSGNTRLQSVSCTSTTDCTAVGFDSTSDGGGTLVERWDGSSWSIVATPDHPDNYDQLSSVSCATSTNCLAIGLLIDSATFDHAPLAERWDGVAWSEVSSPASALAVIACVAVDDCFGVGSSGIEHWDGSSWTTAVPGKTLWSLSCSSSTDCLAVGDTTEHWNGVSWSTVADHGYVAVSCASSTLCAAVNGNQVGGSLIKMWNGSVWANTGPAPGFSQSELHGVSCSSSTSCFAVGRKLTPTNEYVPLIEQWNGTKWLTVPSPNVGGILWGVSCTSSTNCFAVGNDSTNGLIERWNGTSWVVVANPTGSLSGVSCSSSTNCFAVGSGPNGGGTLPLAMRWDGVSWSEVATHAAPSGSTTSQFGGVSCSSVTNCVAVGNFADNGLHPLIERWNGTSWSIEVAAANADSLSSVSCTSPASCIAVGSDRIQRWDGIQWSDANWDRPNYFPNLSSVSCASATNCIAVGSRWYHTTKTLVEKWNGQSWTQIASANSPESPYYANNYLSAVSCKAAVRCFAVGATYLPRSTKTLIERAP